MEKTAVEWLIEQLNSTMGLISFVPNCDKKYKESILSVINQAKEIEKQQIVKAHGNKKKHARDTGNYQYTYTGEMYFNDNYY
jgi:hypothetical protein